MAGPYLSQYRERLENNSESTVHGKWWKYRPKQLFVDSFLNAGQVNFIDGSAANTTASRLLYGNRTFVLYKYGLPPYWSEDGITWTAGNGPIFNSSKSQHPTVLPTDFVGGMFIAMTEEQIAVSTNGREWSVYPSVPGLYIGNLRYGQLIAFTYAYSRLIAVYNTQTDPSNVNSYKTLFSSTSNFTTWQTPIEFSPSGWITWQLEIEYGRKILYNGSSVMFVSPFYDINGNAKVFSCLSSNGTSWNFYDTLISGEDAESFATIPTSYVLQHHNNIWRIYVLSRIYTSVDGITWTANDLPFNDLLARTVRYFPEINTFFLSRLSANTPPFYSSDGLNYTQAIVNTGVIIRPLQYAISDDGKVIMAACPGSANGAAIYSTDNGRTWSVFRRNGFSWVIFANNRFVFSGPFGIMSVNYK